MRALDSIHVTRWGTSGPRIVLVHGGVQGGSAGGAANFSKQRELADRGYQLLVPDRPGHGLSAPAGRPDDSKADGEWVAELLGDGAHLVGHSFGGCVALAAASRRPEAVRSLTLIEPGMQPVAIDQPAVLWFVLKMVATLRLSFSASARITRFAKLMHIPDEIGGSGSPDELERMGKAALTIKIPQKQVLEAQLAQVAARPIPLLVVTGGWNPGIDLTADKVASLGGGRRLTIASPHHFPQLVSDEFNQLLEGVVRSG